MRKTFIQEYAEPIAQNISSAVEIISAVLIGFAALYALKNYFTILAFKSSSLTQRDIRVKFGSTVAVSLELLLGADVIATAVAPS